MPGQAAPIQETVQDIERLLTLFPQDENNLGEGSPTSPWGLRGVAAVFNQFGVTLTRFCARSIFIAEYSQAATLRNREQLGRMKGRGKHAISGESLVLLRFTGERSFRPR